MSFFGITENDLNDGKATFNGGDKVEMTIASVVKKVIKENDTIIVECVVTQGPGVGLKYSEFFRIGTAGGKRALGIFLTSFMSAAEAAAMQDPNVLINKKFTCEFVADGAYVNMRKVRMVDAVPTGMAAAPVQQEMYTGQTQGVPTPQSAAIGEPAPALSKSLF